MNSHNWYETESLIKFETPCTITLISPSDGGKTTFVKRLLTHSKGMFKTTFERVLYCYGSTWQPIFDQLLKEIPNITFKEGLPSEDELKSFSDGYTHTCIIIDDLMMEINSNTRAEKIWTVFCHHLNMTVLYLAHNIFQKGKSARTISLNTSYFIISKNHRDTLQIQNFARQVYPRKTSFFMDAYNKATSMSAFGYIVVDLNAFSDDRFRLRTNIFPGEDTIIYQPDRF